MWTTKKQIQICKPSTYLNIQEIKPLTKMDETTKPQVEYHSEFYNKTNDTEQWIRLSDGCFRSCWNCYAPKEVKWYPVPDIIRNKVVILDMNFLWAYPTSLMTLKELGKIKVNGRVVHYDFQCGLDFTLLLDETAMILKEARVGRFNNKRHFINGLRIAWDRGIDERNKFKVAIEKLRKAGYRNNQCFMLCNGKITYQECVQKLLVLKEMRVEIDDCWYDNQRRGSVKPIFWTEEQCKHFGKLCRSHNVAIKQNQYDAMDFLYRA